MRESAKLEKSKKKMAEQLTLDPAKPINEKENLSRSPVKSFFRNIFNLQKNYKSNPESLPSAQALETFKFAEIDFQTEKGKQMIYTIFRRNSLTFKSVKTKAAIAVPEIDFKYNNDKERKAVELFLKNLHPSSGLLQLTVMLRDLYIDTTAFGTGFMDPIWNKKKNMMIGLKKIHPISMDLIRDSGFGEGGEVKLNAKGNPIGWIQKINQKTKILAFNKVGFLTFNIIGDEWLGISDLEPVYQNVWRLMNIEEGIATAIFRHGFPLYDIKVSGASEGRPPTKEQLEEAAKEVAGLNYKSEFVHGPNYMVKLLESFSIGKSSDYVEPFIDQIVAMSDLPKFVLLGSLEKVGKSGAGELVKFIKPLLKPSKDKLKLFFEEQILQPLMIANNIDTVPELIIGDLPLLEEEIKAKVTGIPGNKETEGTPVIEEDLSELKKKVNRAAEKETEIIKENKKKPEAKRKHKFKAAEWTHPNGHPRCLICGDEERIGGICEAIDEKLKEEEKKKKKSAPAPASIPPRTDGINLANPKGRNLMNEETKQLAFSIKDEKAMKKFIGKETSVYEGNKLVGKIKLREPRKINLNEFIDLEYAHKIEGDERELRWPGETSFLVYEFDIIKKLGEK